MRLDVDLSFDAVPGRPLGSGDARPLDLHAIAAAARSPARLRELLRDRPYDEVRVRSGELPLSALQAAVLLFVVLVEAPRFVVDGKAFGRVAFARYALAKAMVGVPGELALTAVLTLRVQRSSQRRYFLPSRSPAPRRALYLRTDPTLKWLGAQVGGAATHTSGVINGLVANRIEVEVLAAERPNATEQAAFTSVPARRILHLVRGLTNTDYATVVLAAARGHGADFVYERYQLGSYAGLELARRLGIPLVLEFNGSEIWIERNWGSGSVRLSSPLERLERRNLADASLIVVVSAPLRDYAVDHGAAIERVLVNPNGVDTDRLAAYRSEPPEVWRERLGLAEHPTVGFIGTFGPWHGVTLLPALIEQVPHARFVLVGDGSLLPDVREDIHSRGLESRVFLTGIVEHERALQLLAACDVCVSPHVHNPDGTEFFGSPTKLFEYMGLRKSIVASDLGQIGEVIEHERNGLLSAPGDVPAAAAAVNRLLGDADLRERLAAAALEDAVSTYSWTAHARRILDALSRGVTPPTSQAVASVRRS
jgi:glycosyltransferase involved in cell wall biosynthesis